MSSVPIDRVPIDHIVSRVTEAIVERSRISRRNYLDMVTMSARAGKHRVTLSCGNLAHTVAACSTTEKQSILNFTQSNLAIVTAYNDMLSAHVPYRDYPEKIKASLRALGHTAQIAGGVPAMCDGVTQGQPGMELSLFSRDLIAQATALSLSHATYDGILLLGICDKIAPGQLIGALSFGHLPGAFVPAGPMGTGIANDEKVKIRQQYASGEVGKAVLLDMECRAYHSEGTCTFYGTANTNQLVFEAMGLMLPGSAFVPPHDPLREKLTEQVAQLIARQSPGVADYRPLAHVVDEKSVVNGLVALLASGGSTNHTMHLIAVARAAGWIVTWDDFDALSQVVPLLTRIYPNGPADINAFQQAGGVPCLLTQLAERGLLHLDATPICGQMTDYLCYPQLSGEQIGYHPAGSSANPEVIAAPGESFSTQGGLRVMKGNLGRGVIKISAVAEQYRVIEAPVRVFDDQNDVERAYQQGEFRDDVIIVVRYNGPAANGMPELHKLMPILGNLMADGLKVALLTDGRLSGASGKVPAVIHVTPEAQNGGPLSQLRDGMRVRINASEGAMMVLDPLMPSSGAHQPISAQGYGRELFSLFREHVSSAEQGASIFQYPA